MLALLGLAVGVLISWENDYADDYYNELDGNVVQKAAHVYVKLETRYPAFF